MNQYGYGSSDSQVEYLGVDIVDILRVLCRNLWRIAICFVICAAVTCGCAYTFIEPKYKAVSKLSVIGDDRNADASAYNVLDKIMGDYMIMLKNKSILTEVCKNLGITSFITYDKLYDMIELSNGENTHIIDITVTTTDPQLSMDIANEMLECAHYMIPTMLPVTSPSVADYADVPQVQDSPNYVICSAVGGAAGALICAVVVIYRFYSNETVVGFDDVVRYLGRQPLAVVPSFHFNIKKQNRKNRLEKMSKMPCVRGKSDD